MNFEHTEERRMLQDTLARYLNDQYAFETRDEIAQSAAGYSATHWQQLAEMGIVAALFDEDHGGFGGSGFDITVVFEELGRKLVVEPVLGTLMAGQTLAAAGSEQQQNRLEQLISGEIKTAFAHGEPDSFFAMSHVATRAENQADGWQLNGAKAVVMQAEAADMFVISARTSGADTDQQGLSLFVVPADAAGLSLRGYTLTDGGRAAELSLNDVTLAADALLGQQDQAFAVIEQALGAGVLALCAESLGAMEAAKEATLEYLRTRKQFGIPIGSFQALQHRMGDVLLEIEQARSAVIRAAAAFDGDDRLARERALSAAKYTIGRVGTLVAEEAIQLHGGIGMTWELPLAHYAKRLVMIDHQLGDTDFHLQRYMALGNG